MRIYKKYGWVKSGLSDYILTKISSKQKKPTKRFKNPSNKLTLSTLSFIISTHLNHKTPGLARDAIKDDTYFWFINLTNRFTKKNRVAGIWIIIIIFFVQEIFSWNCCSTVINSQFSNKRRYIYEVILYFFNCCSDESCLQFLL